MIKNVKVFFQTYKSLIYNFFHFKSLMRIRRNFQIDINGRFSQEEGKKLVFRSMRWKLGKWGIPILLETFFFSIRKLTDFSPYVSLSINSYLKLHICFYFGVSNRFTFYFFPPSIVVIQGPFLNECPIHSFFHFWHLFHNVSWGYSSS